MPLYTEHLGEHIRLAVLSDGSFKLDAGTMFGIIFTLAFNPLLIQEHGQNILLDAGIGDKARYSPKMQKTKPFSCLNHGSGV